jgi:hypothetical protein
MPIQTAADSISNSAGSPYGFKNRIINGAMAIDQRNAGAQITGAGNVYTVDRFLIQGSQTGKFNVQQVTDAPAGFINSLKFTVGTAVSVGSGDYFIIRQAIEGLNVADLDYGLSTAKTTTLSFWVKSSITGLHSGHLTNASSARWYPFTYTISSANTWEYKTITIPGDTTGTWLKDNSVGIYVGWSLGTGSSNETTANAWSSSTGIGATGSVDVVATSGATFFITGVQFEKGSQATAFDYRPFGTELALCQRYFEKSYDTFSPVPTNTTLGNHVGIVDTQSLTAIAANIKFRVEKRTNPTMNFYKFETTAGVWARNSDNASTGTITTPWGMGSTGVGRLDSSTSLTSGAMYHGQWSATAEL